MNQYNYLNILKNNLSQSASKLGLDRSFTFQQDNDPKHTARVVREWLLYNVRKQVKTPPQSPDLNPIEHLWDYFDRQIRKQEIKTKNDLKKALLEEWQKIPSSITQNLVKSVPSR
ncbi:transposable element Tcb2 transposase [Trichonephila clavipes]|nr:transposable element Tcb2 transposase [Trichonephila clavipes]